MKAITAALVTLSLLAPAAAGETVAAAARGYRLLLEKPYVPPYFDQETFDNTWQVWPEPWRSRAAKATPGERREMAFARYGLTRRPGDATDKPLQFVVTRDGDWVPNCFTCHGGQLLDEPLPGLPNIDYALQTLIQETRWTKVRLGKRLMPIDVGALVMPLGTTVGTTNAVIFGVALAAHRDADLNVLPQAPLPELLHHDMDAPPWWHFRKKDRIYLDGFAEKAHRPLMQFALDRSNGPQKFREWEEDFRDIFAYLESIEPPPFPFPIEPDLAAAGRLAFQRVCAECHGSYGDRETYPHRIVSIEELGTDRARFDALSAAHREDYRNNWFSGYGEDDVIIDPDGYMAPPLDGIWASAPYLHNGSVPTLWHLLHPDQRPAVWTRDGQAYDREQGGLGIRTFDEMPQISHASARRHYFDTRRPGKSASGHRFPEVLTEADRRAVLEYLKTL